jgi:predicted O-methyltransferase YrrM
MESYKYTKPWFLDSEAIKLLLTYVDKTRINRILEIGSYEGLSSVCAAAGVWSPNATH